MGFEVEVYVSLRFFKLEIVQENREGPADLADLVGNNGRDLAERVVLAVHIRPEGVRIVAALGAHTGTVLAETLTPPVEIRSLVEL